MNQPFYLLSFLKSSGVLLSLIFLMSPIPVFAHAGHGDEFHSESEATTPSGITVDAQTLQRLGIRIEPVTRDFMNIGIKTTGKIETLPRKTVEVTSPLAGKVIELLVEPGDTVSQGQVVAVLSSPELVSLRVEALQNQGEAEAHLKQAEANLELAQQNYQRQQNIAAAEIEQANEQLKAAQLRYERDQAIVERGAVVGVTRENYQRQIEIAKAEIEQAETTLEVALENYQRDEELTNAGALPRRNFLESKERLANAKTDLARAQSRRDVLSADTEVKQAEIDLPVRDLRESETLLAEAEAQLIRANQKREVLEAEAELKRAAAELEAAKSNLNLSKTTYETRLQQLGTGGNTEGKVIITAPISGVVSHREITLGQSVDDAGLPLMKIQDNSQVWATANLYEKDIAQVRLGQNVRLKVASLPDQVFQGRVAQISPFVEGETRVISVRAELENKDNLLKPGMFAELELMTEKTANSVISIPENAIVEANGKALVYVQNGQDFTPVEVTVGQQFANQVEITQGLFEGDKIVTEGSIQLYAQSLRGGTKTAEKQEDETHSSTPVKPQLMGIEMPQTVPGWLVFPAFGLIASTAFWLGRRSQNSSEKQTEVSGEVIDSLVNLD
ncbi:efflux RND transporter periplasmic adaptor subunit [Limnoraphis robusta]|uniref:Efflux RND transporter periplasmic adaptor subunit n=1 Tax=Limnoraphis robusta CCNP1315 TaxID=3110306 RepID=A0ABU5U3X8_9CYAN|nr:efflux RND transporter periplasmic adaptor subunit [Limnoraphis robusta]MEA5521770.1 efflux RND transporter periplasmic adaptor subunit [Limnoraphis robusta CCNP1315]MEA5546134.1 efflux RND transporter periplasmic adaptor subunit [Limnoraphis robusta CCNP1324]